MREIAKYGCGWMGLVVGLVVFIGILSFGLWALGVGLASITGRGEAHKRINSAEMRIAAYDSFFNQCASIQGLEGQIDELVVQYAEASEGKPKDIALTALVGTKALRHQAIRKYNADARKNYTEGQFRDSDLPYQIPDTNYPEEGSKTSCGAN